MAEQERGVTFPATETGERSTSALGRRVVADALRAVDPPGAHAAERETAWRSGYLVHFRRLVEAGLTSREAALTIARDGLASLHEHLHYVHPGGEETPLTAAQDAAPARRLATATVQGTEPAERELSLPLHGERIRGAALHRRLDAWQEAGVLEPSAADAVREVAANPDWLALPGHTVVVLGAGAEMGPLRALLRWGATVAGIDLPRPELWRRVLEAARRGAGTLHVPVAREGADPLTAGSDLVREVPEAAAWLADLGAGPLVLGNYVYADGATNVRVSAAVDALTVRVARERPEAALAFLATPTDVFAVPGDAVRQATEKYARRSAVGRLAGRPLRTASRGRLLARAYAPDVDPGIYDSLVPQQGPNYALAKRLQRWRAAAARDAGTTTSLHVAPPTRTRSVVKNRALAAAYAGAHRFGVEVFEPATSNTLMAALLVHDLHRPAPPADHPWQDEARGAVHGGLWRAAYAPRTALGLAAVLGLGSART